MESEQLLKELLLKLPTDFQSRIKILTSLQEMIMKEEIANLYAMQRESELLSSQKLISAQQKNGQLISENQRLRNELQKLDLIRTSVESITRTSPPPILTSSPSPSSSLLDNATSSFTISPPNSLNSLSNQRIPLNISSPSLSLSQLSLDSSLQATENIMQPPQQQQHVDLLAAIDRKVVRQPIQSTSSKVSLSLGTSSAGSSGSPRSIANGKTFFRECRKRLDTATFDSFINVIRWLKVNSVTRDDVFEKASKMFGSKKNLDLISQLHDLLYTV
jgi:hypothetical protein